MSDFALMSLGVGVLVFLSIGGVLLVIFPKILGGSRSDQRVAGIAASNRKAKKRGDKQDSVQARRKQVQDKLKDLEDQQKAKKVSVRLSTRLERAGLNITTLTFHLYSVGFGLMVALGVFMVGSNIWAAIGAAFAAGLGLPRWVLKFLMKRRQAKFRDEFANAIDVIVRGLKSGLPVNDCVKVIAAESADPVGPEFVEIVDGQKLGITLDQGLLRMYERVPLAEVNFLSIVISIQQKTGGNLAEALSNLTVVLRDRKKMQGKIRAMSQEAKSSASIIGALPFVVMLLVYMSSPDYIAMLWTEQIGQLLMAGSAIWMTIGILIMRKMINFDF